MPSARGTARAVVEGRRTQAGIILTNDRWNSVYPTVGIVPVRETVQPLEAPHSVQLASGGFAVACDLVNVFHPPQPASPLGAQVFVVPPDELAAIEDQLCLFLQLPRLLGPRPMKGRPVPSARAYPFWSEIYFSEPPINGQLKRRIIVSPDAWNAVAGRVTLVRTTSQIKVDHGSFPEIQRGQARAACGDMTTVPTTDVVLDPQRRPSPSATTVADMVAIARGLTVTHDLAAAVARNLAP